MGTSIGWDNACFMSHLNEQCDITVALRNLDVVVIRGGCHRRTSALQNQTALRQRPVFRPIEFVSAICCSPLLLPFARSRQYWRNPSILGIDDQRRAPGFDDGCSSVPPEVIVGTTDVLFGGAVAAIHVALCDLLFHVCRGFLFRKEFFIGQICRPFKRRQRSETPCALQIRFPVGQARCCRALCGSRCL